jgi:hypothetical protein
MLGYHVISPGASPLDFLIPKALRPLREGKSYYEKHSQSTPFIAIGHVIRELKSLAVLGHGIQLVIGDYHVI